MELFHVNHRPRASPSHPKLNRRADGLDLPCPAISDRVDERRDTSAPDHGRLAVLVWAVRRLSPPSHAEMLRRSP